MFRTGSFFVRFLIALLVIGLLVAAGVAVYRAGFSQGYVLGAVAGAGENLPDRPGAPLYPGFWGYAPGFYRPHFGFGFFPFFPLFGLLLFGLLIFWLVGGLFRARRWGWYGHPHGYPPHWGPPPGAGQAPEAAKPAEGDEGSRGKGE
jgi:hypothetical protein